jgi:dTDP-4-amino-4,6-dideoxygalactose transaminase
MTRALAIDGGVPVFPDGVPFVRAPAPPLARVTELLEPSWSQGMLTNGPLVRRLEAEAASLLGVEHVVAVASCTTGLMLVIRALDMRGDVLLPSFTFSASAHAIAWNGLRPRFAECDPASFQLAMDDATARAAETSAGRIGGILATHVFGAPCDAEAVVELGRAHKVPVVFDAAHAIGSLRNGTPVSRFGDASVFSMTPTKPLVAGEGGLVATNRADLAHLVRIGRDYANPGDYDTQFVGLNGRLSEMHAAVALASLEIFPVQQKQRDEIAGCYRDELAGIPGIAIQHVDAGDVSTYKDFTIAVDAEAFGADRDLLRNALKAEGVDTRCYFDPPVHRQTAYAPTSPMALPAVDLPVTDAAARSVLSLPIYPALGLENVARIASLIADVHAARAR